jgi:hypothetical protein
MGAYQAMAILKEKYVEIEFKPILPCQKLIERIKKCIILDYDK